MKWSSTFGFRNIGRFRNADRFRNGLCFTAATRQSEVLVPFLSFGLGWVTKE
jgi:hypothetical protein